MSILIYNLQNKAKVAHIHPFKNVMQAGKLSGLI